MLSKRAHSLNLCKTRDLPALADKMHEMHERRRREKSMSKPLSAKTMVCSEYQRLLEQCQSALYIWNEHRAEMDQAGLSGKEAGDELLGLQAKYARAYTVLQNHGRNCLRCKSVSRTKRCDSENDSGTLSDNTLYA